MNPSLSVLLPVHNSQATLSRLVAQLLEVLPELTPRFDLLIIDDGSTDATVEVAYDLCRDFPQMRLVAHSSRMGFEGALRSGFQHTKGEVILVRSEDCRLDLYGVHKLWERMAVDEMVVARASTRSPLGWIPRVPTPGKLAEMPIADLQMFRRRMVEAWLRPGNRETWGEFLARQSFPIREVKVAERIAAGQAVRGSGNGLVRRPNYMARIKNFALGE